MPAWLDLGVTGVADALSVAGVAWIALGTVLGLVFAQRAARRSGIAFYVAYRRALGKSILLGLELLVGADIIRTVTGVETLQNLMVLAVVVLIRTFLSVTLSMEIEGRWPWQREPSPQRHT
jgi:uncharacterized membrane protein